MIPPKESGPLEDADDSPEKPPASDTSALPALSEGCSWNWLPDEHAEAGGEGQKGQSRVRVKAWRKAWLGPQWLGPSPAPSPSPPPFRDDASAAWPAPAALRLRFRRDDADATVDEWAFVQGPWRIIRTLVWLKRFRLVLLADTVRGVITPEMQRMHWRWALEVPAKLAVTPWESTAAWRLTHPSRRSVMLIPCAVPHEATAQGKEQAMENPPATCRWVTSPTALSAGHFALSLALRPESRNAGQTGSPRGLSDLPMVVRNWMPILISWDPVRHRKLPIWTPLTVSERSRVCRSTRAWGGRITFGTESFILYRSLSQPQPRALIGAQTRSRMLIARFTPTGSVQPILTVDGS